MGKHDASIIQGVDIRHREKEFDEFAECYSCTVNSSYNKVRYSKALVIIKIYSQKVLQMLLYMNTWNMNITALFEDLLELGYSTC